MFEDKKAKSVEQQKRNMKINWIVFCYEVQKKYNMRNNEWWELFLLASKVKNSSLMSSKKRKEKKRKEKKREKINKIRIERYSRQKKKFDHFQFWWVLNFSMIKTKSYQWMSHRIWRALRCSWCSGGSRLQHEPWCPASSKGLQFKDRTVKCKDRRDTAENKRRKGVSRSDMRRSAK